MYRGQALFLASIYTIKFVIFASTFANIIDLFFCVFFL